MTSPHSPFRPCRALATDGTRCSYPDGHPPVPSSSGRLYAHARIDARTTPWYWGTPASPQPAPRYELPTSPPASLAEVRTRVFDYFPCAPAECSPTHTCEVHTQLYILTTAVALDTRHTTLVDAADAYAATTSEEYQALAVERYRPGGPSIPEIWLRLRANPDPAPAPAPAHPEEPAS